MRPTPIAALTRVAGPRDPRGGIANCTASPGRRTAAGTTRPIPYAKNRPATTAATPTKAGALRTYRVDMKKLSDIPARNEIRAAPNRRRMLVHRNPENGIDRNRPPIIGIRISTR